jgi:hypothetical protein
MYQLETISSNATSNFLAVIQYSEYSQTIWCHPASQSSTERNRMNDSNGLAVEGFVLRAYECMSSNEIDRHHPLVSWAQASVSSSNANFSTTKINIIKTLEGVQYTLHYAKGYTEILNKLGDFEVLLRASLSHTLPHNSLLQFPQCLNRACSIHNPLQTDPHRFHPRLAI